MMGLFKRRTASSVATQQTSAGRTVVAAAMPLAGKDGAQAWKARGGGEAWQHDAWYYYDAIGEMRFATNWIANAISRASLFAAEKDPETGKLTGPTEDPRVQAATMQILGGPEERPQLQKTMALHWQIAGETFVLVQPQGAGKPDKWLALSSRALTERGGKWKYKDPFTGVDTPLNPGRDRLIRLWSPHPNEQTHADSSVRASLPILRELEKTSQNVIARLDSRLSGNGLLFVPQEMDFPHNEGEPADSASLVQLLLDAAEASLSTPGTAAAQVPIAVQVPGEMIGQIQHLDLSTDFDSAVAELRRDGFERLGRSLDMPKQVALGTLAESNHWSAWQIEEETYKLHVEPLLLKMGTAFTVEYLRPALEAMGVQNPDRYVLDWDISEVTGRPNRSEDMRDLHTRGLISDDYMRAESGIPDEAIPDDDESQRRLLTDLVKAQPTLMETPWIAEYLGFDVPDVIEEAAETPNMEVTSPGSDIRALPDRPSSVDNTPDEGLVAAAELVVFDALSRAGGRLLTRQYRGRFGDVDKWALHTVIPHGADDMPRLLEGSFQFTDNIARAWGREPGALRDSIASYVRTCLANGMEHDRETLRSFL